MKRIITLIGMALVAVCAFAQKIPEGRELFPLSWDFGNDYVNSWTGADFEKIDTLNDEYVIGGYCVNKSGLGYQKQAYRVTLKGNGNSFSVEVTDMMTAACDKDGNLLKTAKPIANPKSPMTKVASLILNDLTKRINGWTDDEYEAKLNDAVTNPIFLHIVLQNTTDLYTKKFFTTYNILGRKTEFEIAFEVIEETKRAGFAYEARNLIDKNGVLNGGYQIPLVFVYSNNDKLVVLKKGTSYKVVGTIVEIDLKLGKDSIRMSIEE